MLLNLITSTGSYAPKFTVLSSHSQLNDVSCQDDLDAIVTSESVLDILQCCGITTGVTVSTIQH